jgi:hypothetical protein
MGSAYGGQAMNTDLDKHQRGANDAACFDFIGSIFASWCYIDRTRILGLRRIL